MPLETLLDIAFHFTGAVIEETLISWKPAARSEKIYEKLKSFQGKSVIVRTGEFLANGKFKFDSTNEVESFKAELSDKGIVIYTADNTPFEIEGKTLSRIYTGQKGPGRICINTSKTDFLIDLIEIT
jgi:hypothetical protein